MLGTQGVWGWFEYVEGYHLPGVRDLAWVSGSLFFGFSAIFQWTTKPCKIAYPSRQRRAYQIWRTSGATDGQAKARRLRLESGLMQGVGVRFEPEADYLDPN